MNRLFQMLSFMLLFSLFIRCGKETVPPKNSILPTNDGLPYHFAEGHYEMDENGFPLAPYEYQLPLCNTNEKLTYLIRLPDMDLVEDISRLPQILQLKEYTGVSIEYILLETSFAGLYETIMASDFDYDILSGNREYMEAAYKSGNKGEHWCNLFEYRQYCPNYLYQSTRDLDDLTFDTVFYDDETIPFFYTILDKSVAASGYMARGDWLDEAAILSASAGVLRKSHSAACQY
jgi:hypothetical protein